MTSDRSLPLTGFGELVGGFKVFVRDARATLLPLLDLLSPPSLGLGDLLPERWGLVECAERDFESVNAEEGDEER